MLVPIGLSTNLSYTGLNKPTTGLDAQLAKFQKELSNCVNCESSKTSEGKATIQAIAGKINEIKSQIEEIANTKAANQQTALKQSVDTNTPLNKYSEVSLVKDNNEFLSKANEVSAGSYLDVFV